MHSGGDGTAKSGDVDNPEENLWPFFNSSCFNGFHDGNTILYVYCSAVTPVLLFVKGRMGFILSIGSSSIAYTRTK